MVDATGRAIGKAAKDDLRNDSLASVGANASSGGLFFSATRSSSACVCRSIVPKALFVTASPLFLD